MLVVGTVVMMSLVALCDFLVLSGASGASSLASAVGAAKPRSAAVSVLSIVSPSTKLAIHATRLGVTIGTAKSVAGEAVTGGVSIPNLGHPAASTGSSSVVRVRKNHPLPTTTTTTTTQPRGQSSAPTTTTTDPPTTTTSTTRPAPTTTTTTVPPTTTTSTTRPAPTTTTTTQPAPTTTTTTVPPTTTTSTTRPAPTTTTTTQPATTTTTTTQPSSSRPAGLIQAGDSKVNCITDSPGAPLVQDAAYTGVTYNCVETYTDADPTWADWINPWIASPNEPFVPWVTADPTQHSLIDTQNLIPDSEATDPNWTAECAAGDFNTYAQEFATTMVNAGLGYTVIRLGHEMNGTWYNDSLGDTLESWQQWGECFAQEVTAMRSVPGAHFLFDWCVNANYRDIPLADFYPGDAYVDIIGIDFYDQTGETIPAVGQPGRFQALASEDLGLDAVEAFAAAHNKPLSIPEWGTVTTQGDDPAYVTGIGDFVASNDVAYQAWFNAGDDNIYQLNPAQDPLSVAAYTAAFA